MYFLIGIWGGPRREYAAIKFFLYTLLGSVLLLLGILALYFYNGAHTFDMTVLWQNNGYARYFQNLVWFAFFIGFAIKVPVFPFHTWLPDAHVEAPTAISVILAGVLLKMGTYGMMRINFPILPEATRHFALFLAVMGVINILYGALCAMAQKDLKKLVAYSSVSHMGYCLLGMAAITVAGMNGALLQMFNHGTTTAMLFLLVGVIYDRAHHREINGFGGLAVQMPIYTGIVALAFFASLGLPGLSGFISEALVLLGAFPVYRALVIASTIGIVLTAGYLLWTLQRMFLGTLNPKYKDLPDVNGREIFTLAPLGVIVVILGVFPMPALNLFRSSMAWIVHMVNPSMGGGLVP
jgi:NADH-quinone oxidoreductase subunit M